MINLDKLCDTWVAILPDWYCIVLSKLRKMPSFPFTTYLIWFKLGIKFNQDNLIKVLAITIEFRKRKEKPHVMCFIIQHVYATP